MAVTVAPTTYGAAAYRVLTDAVAAAKGGNPLAPVTVLVPGERIGVTVRRALARGVRPGAPGVAAVRVLTLRRLAEQLAGAAFARRGLRPLTAPVLAAAVREVLRAEPGIFGPVAGHIGTVRAIARAHRALRAVPEPVLDRLAAAGEVSAETVRLHRVLRHRCAADFFDEADLLTSAVDRAGGSTDPVLVFLPQDLDPPDTALLAALGRVVPVHLVVGLTGDPAADARPLALCRDLGVPVRSRTHPPCGDVVLHASDPDDEVRCVVRRAVAALADRPGYRVAVLYGAPDPYARLVHEHLARAGVPVFGAGVRPTAEGRLGRAILRLLALPDSHFRRGDVLAFVADAPVCHAGARVPASAWERVSRAAGVVAGPDWDRLADYAAQRDTWLLDHPDAEEWRADRARREAATARALHDFVGSVRNGLCIAGQAHSWSELGEAVLRVWDLVLGGPAEIERLAPEEQRAAERIAGTLGLLAGLDVFAAAPDPVLLSELLELELADDLDRVGRAGTGVQVGPVADGVGADLDRVFVLGVAEGLLPARAADDPLLPDRVRELTGGTLPTMRERQARTHRQLLAALAAAPPGGRTLSYPRGDLRRGGSRVGSRWLAPTLDNPLVEVIGSPSYPGAVRAEPYPATPQEWRQRAAVDRRADAPADPVLDRALAVRAARSSAEFTVFDGNLAGESVPDPTGAAVVSATALESWVCCPHGYFLRHLLRVAPVQQPEEVVRISPADRGTVLHDVLERLVRAAGAQDWAPGPGEPWPEQAGAVLAEAAATRFARAEEAGITGFALLWELDRRAMLDDLADWLRRDDERRRELGGLAPVAAEWGFDGAEVDLGDGRALRLRGRIDRIDRAADGTLVVTDYKTGRPDPFRAIAADPCDRGQRLQLPLYALAARAGFGGGPVRAEYWFVTRRGRFERIGLTLDDAVLDRTRLALRTVADGIAGGMFLARARDRTNPLYECPGCDLGAGDAGVARAWERKGGAARLAPLRALLGIG